MSIFDFGTLWFDAEGSPYWVFPDDSDDLPPALDEDDLREDDDDFRDTEAVNLLYCNRNPNGTPCYVCRPFIGRVYMYGTEPRVPVHRHCYCYYIHTSRPVTVG